MTRTGFRCFFLLIICYVTISQGAEINLIDRNSEARLGSIRYITIGKNVYIPIEEFANILTIPFSRDNQRKSIELLYQSKTIRFAAYTPFVSIGQTTVQMSLEVLFPNGDFYVPLVDVLKAFAIGNIHTIDYEPDFQRLVITTRPPNIIALSAVVKDHTLTLILKTTKAFKLDDIGRRQDKEWIYLTISGGVIDKSIKWDGEPYPQVFEFLTKQTSPTECRIALHVAPNVELREITTQDSPNSIQLELVTRNGISSAVLAELQKEQEKWKIDTIVIDPGHGGKDGGCSASNGIKEKNIALAIAKMVKSELEKRTKAKILLTRDRDVFIPLKGRTKLANKNGGKLFVSIHVDANRVKGLRGHTVYFLGPAKTEEARQVAQFENSVIQFEDTQNDYAAMSDAAFILAANAQNSYNKESEELASIIDDKITSYCNSSSIGVRQAGFYVLYGASMPNVLVETGFITNSRDRQKLVTRSYQASLAKAIADGIIEFKSLYEQTDF